MKRTKRIALLLLATVCLMVFAAGCSSEAQNETDAVTTASVSTNMYTNMDQAAVSIPVCAMWPRLMPMVPPIWLFLYPGL